MKNILITGATDGIGLETAKLFAKEGQREFAKCQAQRKIEVEKDS